MIEIQMSKDIKDFSPKIVGPFSMRQLVCTGISFAYGFPLAAVLLNHTEIDISTALTIVAVTMAPSIACGFVKLFGLYLDQFVFQCVIPLFLSPSVRRYKSVNTFAFLDPNKAKASSVPTTPKKMGREEKKKRKADYLKYKAAK